MNKVSLFDISTNSSLKENFFDELESLINQSDWIGGNSVTTFENNFKEFIGSKHCISVNSGTDALELSLRAYNIKSGDKVIVPAFSFFATSEAVLKIGAIPVYCDIDKNDLNIDINSFDFKLDDSVKAIIPVHLFGNPAKLDKIIKFAKENKLVVIEDVAQAFGSKNNQDYLGTMGDVGCFSFYPTKNLGGFGDGGCIITDNSEVAKKLTYLRNHGQTKKYYHEYIGYNSRLDNVQATILNLKLKNIKNELLTRTKISSLYKHLLNDNPNILIHTDSKNPLNLFPISFSSIKQLNKVKKVLAKNDIEYGNYYPYGLHEFPISGNQVSSDLVNVNWATKNVLTLPNHPRLRDDDVKFISEAINSIF